MKDKDVMGVSGGVARAAIGVAGRGVYVGSRWWLRHAVGLSEWWFGMGVWVEW